jgi:hypothetical protein
MTPCFKTSQASGIVKPSLVSSSRKCFDGLILPAEPKQSRRAAMARTAVRRPKGIYCNISYDDIMSTGCVRESCTGPLRPFTGRFCRWADVSVSRLFNGELAAVPSLFGMYVLRGNVMPARRGGNTRVTLDESLRPGEVLPPGGVIGVLCGRVTSGGIQNEATYLFCRGRAAGS